MSVGIDHPTRTDTPAEPHVGGTGRAPALDDAAEPLVVRGDELRSMVEGRVADAPRRHPPSDATGLVEHDDLMGPTELTSGDQPRNPRADDHHLGDSWGCGPSDDGSLLMVGRSGHGDSLAATAGGQPCNRSDRPAPGDSYARPMSDTLIDLLFGIMLVAVGAVFCFRGYLAMRVIIPMWGALAGFVLGAGLVSNLGNERFLASALSWFVGLAVALLFGLLAYLYYEVAVVLAMSAIGFAIGTSVMAILGVSWSWLVVLVGVITGAVLAVVRDRREPPDGTAHRAHRAGGVLDDRDRCPAGHRQAQREPAVGCGDEHHGR